MSSASTNSMVADDMLPNRRSTSREALSAVSAALLTAYDMLKSLDRGMRIEGVRLLRQEGGRSGTWVREDPA